MTVDYRAGDKLCLSYRQQLMLKKRLDFLGYARKTGNRVSISKRFIGRRPHFFPQTTTTLPAH
jgi:hypothetical protein